MSFITSSDYRDTSGETGLSRVPKLHKRKDLPILVSLDEVIFSQSPRKIKKIRALAPKSKCVPIATQNEALKRNLRIAREINYHVTRTVKFSSNFPMRRRGSRVLAPNEIDLFRKEFVFKVAELTEIRKKTSVRSFEERIEKLSRIARKGKGNCDEMTALAYDFGTKLAPNKHFYFSRIRGGDHAFLCISNVAVNSFHELNENSVIADPWSDSYYPVSMYRDHLVDSVGITDEENRIETLVKKFNPKNQEIEFLK